MFASLSNAGAQHRRGHGRRLSGIEGLIGSSFADQLLGDSGANELRGGGGNDQLAGFGGNDRLDGGTGDDILAGGAGSDTFLFGEDFGRDTITDWQDGILLATSDLI